MPSARSSASFPIPTPPPPRKVPHAEPGFTLNEILIAVGIIGILTSIVIVAINPTENLLSAQHSKRRVYNRQQMTAIMQYWQDNGVDPADNIPTGLAERMPICRPGITDDPTCVNLDLLTENQTYLVDIPVDVVEAELDTNYTGYMIYQYNGADVFVCNYRLPPTDEQYCQGPATYYASSSSLSGGMASDGSSSSGFSSASSAGSAGASSAAASSGGASSAAASSSSAVAASSAAGDSSSGYGCSAQIGISFTSVTNLGAGNAQPYLYVGNTGSLLHSGQYTALMESGSPVIDMPGNLNRPGPYLERRNGYVRFLDYGNLPTESDQEQLTGQLLFNGATITSVINGTGNDGFEFQGDTIIDLANLNDEFRTDGTFGMNVSIANDYVDVYYTCTGATSSASTSTAMSAGTSSAAASSAPAASSSVSSSSTGGGLGVNCMEMASECVEHCGVTINPGDGTYCQDIFGEPEAYPFLCMACISIE